MLGDRIRLADHFLDPGVFIRSMATRGSLGGLAEAALQAALLMDASGKDDVLLETVGVGQGEIDIVDHADTIVLALMPGSGDSVQALKAGVMEIPDVIVVNKADHPLADTMVREVRGASVARSAGLVEGAGGANRGVQGRGDRRAARADRRHRAAHRGDGLARRAQGSQPARRGARASPRRGCGAGSRIEQTTDPEWQGMLDEVVRRRDGSRHGGGQASGAGRDRLSSRLNRGARRCATRKPRCARRARGGCYKASADQSNGAVPLPPAVAAASATITRVRRPRAPR